MEFSLSHTPGQVLIAVADVPVGVDVERHPDDPVALAGLLHPRETDEISAAAHGTLDGGRATVRFTRAWSRTEAYLKGIASGWAVTHTSTTSAPTTPPAAPSDRGSCGTWPCPRGTAPRWPCSAEPAEILALSAARWPPRPSSARGPTSPARLST